MLHLYVKKLFKHWNGWLYLEEIHYLSWELVTWKRVISCGIVKNFGIHVIQFTHEVK